MSEFVDPGSSEKNGIMRSALYWLGRYAVHFIDGMEKISRTQMEYAKYSEVMHAKVVIPPVPDTVEELAATYWQRSS